MVHHDFNMNKGSTKHSKKVDSMNKGFVVESKG